MERYRYSNTATDRVASGADWTPSYATAGAAPQQTHAADDTTAQQSMSVIGKTLTFRGELTANEDLMIQGHVEGSITHTASHLAIGANGDVKANIEARRVIIQGRLVGDVHASESIVIEASANVQGNMFAPKVSLKDGAKFRGHIEMENGLGGAQAKRPKAKAEPNAAQVEELLG
jgi:cytoskeletal protein CcmA (bactofilin family)